MPTASSPSSSRQYDRGGADSKQVGAKEKTRRMDSASSSDDHSQKLRLVKSSNLSADAIAVAEARKNPGDRRRVRDTPASKAPERLTETIQSAPHDSQSRSISRTRNPARTNGARPVQSAPAPPTAAVRQMSSKVGLVVVDEVSSTPRDAVSDQDAYAIAQPRANCSASATDGTHTHIAEELAPSIANENEVPEGALFGSTQKRQKKPRTSPASSPIPTINILPASGLATSQFDITTTTHTSPDIPIVGDEHVPTSKKDTSQNGAFLKAAPFTFTSPIPSKVITSISTQTPPSVVQTTRLAHQALSGAVRQDAPRSGFSASTQTGRPWPDPPTSTKLASNFPFPSLSESSHSDAPRKRRPPRKRRNSIGTVTSSTEGTMNLASGCSRSQPQTPAGSRPGSPTTRRRRGRSNASKSRGARM